METVIMYICFSILLGMPFALALGLEGWTGKVIGIVFGVAIVHVIGLLLPLFT